MSLTTGPIIARQPERQFEELLNEFLKAYFNGVAHQSPLGDVTFPLCDLMFNQADVPNPQSKPQIHTVFTGWRAEEEWWKGGNLGTWVSTLANPASGVSYGRNVEDRIEESVHGWQRRQLLGTDIRWQASGPDFVEQVFFNGAWQTNRTFAGATALRWIRDGLNYLEQANVGGTWTTQRTITPADPVWDGTKKRITVAAELTHFVRVAFRKGGDGNESDFLCRRVAAHLEELLRDTDRTKDLSQKGIHDLMCRRGPQPIPAQGYAMRLLVFTAKLTYWLPKEGM